MPLFVKPQNINKVWSSSGDRVAPTDQKINQGWVPEIPPHQWFNFIDNKQDQAIAHINQMGIPQWDAVTEYQANKSYVQGPTDGVIYRATQTHTNQNPEVTEGYWTVAFLSEAPDYDGTYVRLNQNLADVPNKTQARNNLSVYSIAQADGKFVETEFFSANRSLSPNGYQRLPGGLILQWGRSTGGTGGYNTQHTQAFPIAFPTLCLSVTVGTASDRVTSPMANRFTYLVNHTRTNFTWVSDAIEQSSSPVDVTFFAIGY